MNITIIGAGKIGTRLASILTAENHSITVVDISEKKVDRMVESLDVQGVSGSATLCDTLSESGIKNCDLLIATTPLDEENILSCLIAKKMGAKHTVARVRNPEYAKQMAFMRDELGISMMINPEYAAAREICNVIQFPSAVDVESFAKGRIDIAGIKVKEDSLICNKKISDISNKYKNKLLIGAVNRGGEVFIPNGDFVILEGDTVHLIGSRNDLYSVAREFNNKKNTSIKNIMLIGGSRIAVYLANMLNSIGKNVVIVESDKEICDKLFEHCPFASIINGDYTDYSLLNSEGISLMDAVVTLTDSDEINYLLSNYSENFGVKKSVTKVSDSNLLNLLKNAQIESYVDVSEVTCEIILQYVRAKKSVSSSYMKTLYKLVEGKIEAIEFVASRETKFVGRTLSDIKFKKNVLIAAVIRKNKVLFPSGNDTIELGDRVIVISKDHILYSLNDVVA
jgi:trk system potassium uptake protein TrkA